jgi:hypothetical protein
MYLISIIVSWYHARYPTSIITLINTYPENAKNKDAIQKFVKLGIVYPGSSGSLLGVGLTLKGRRF